MDLVRDILKQLIQPAAVLEEVQPNANGGDETKTEEELQPAGPPAKIGGIGEDGEKQSDNSADAIQKSRYEREQGLHFVFSVSLAVWRG